eukprot:1160176-Pelagomonas_calceolata.AAC.21
MLSGPVPGALTALEGKIITYNLWNACPQLACSIPGQQCWTAHSNPIFRKDGPAKATSPLHIQL